MREQGTQHCAELHPLAPTPSPSPFLTKSIAPPPVALSPILSRKFCIDLMVGLLHGLFYKPSYAFSLFLSRETVCMARVCCSLICFSTPLRTVDCFVQYNPVLWPTTTPLHSTPASSLLLLQSSDFTASARKWRQWAPPPLPPSSCCCSPTTP